ncbi:hypothetical protein M9435_004866 [Picochlorum sp. BPE23]|nr:hypothetical protein M9435_004866 [Picochlorum sp. BPE23]
MIFHSSHPCEIKLGISDTPSKINWYKIQTQFPTWPNNHSSGSLGIQSCELISIPTRTTVVVERGRWLAVGNEKSAIVVRA